MIKEKYFCYEVNRLSSALELHRSAWVKNFMIDVKNED